MAAHESARWSQTAAMHLRAAIGRLEPPPWDAEFGGGLGGATPSALAAYLDYLMPELEARSPTAALDVRQAAEILHALAGLMPRAPQ